MIYCMLAILLSYQLVGFLDWYWVTASFCASFTFFGKVSSTLRSFAGFFHSLSLAKTLYNLLNTLIRLKCPLLILICNSCLSSVSLSSFIELLKYFRWPFQPCLDVSCLLGSGYTSIDCSFCFIAVISSLSSTVSISRFLTSTLTVEIHNFRPNFHNDF